MWLAARLLSGAISEVALEGLPPALRGVAIHAPDLLRMLLINSSSTTGERLRVQVQRHNARGATALAYLADAERGGLMNLFSRRSQVPQQAPAARSQALDGVEVPPLSTVLLEIDVGDAAPPPGQAAATGCMAEEVSAPPPPDLGGEERPPPPPKGCACRLAGPRGGSADAAPPGLLVLAALAALAALRRRAGRRA